MKKILKFMMIIICSIMLVGLSNNCYTYAAGNCAFSCGYGYGDVNMTDVVKNVYNYTLQMGYNSYYSTNGTNNSILDGSFAIGIKRLESDLLFLTGHGGPKYVQTTIGSGLQVGDSNYGPYSGFVGTSTKDWSKVKLAVFYACCTGQGEGNIAYDVFQRSGWKTTTMGWRNEIYIGDVEKWADCFYKKLAAGSTIDQAMIYAGNQKYISDNMKDLSFFGNGSMIVTNHRSANAMDLMDNTKKIEQKYKIEKDKLQLQVLDFMEEYDKEFNRNDYEMSIHNMKQDDSLIIVDLTYKVGEFITNSQYSLVIENGYISQITDNTIKPRTKNEIQSIANKKVTAEKIEKAKKVAKNKNQEKINEENITLVKEKTTLFLDLNTNKQYIRVFDTFGYTDNIDSRIGSFYDYEI